MNKNNIFIITYKYHLTWDPDCLEERTMSCHEMPLYIKDPEDTQDYDRITIKPTFYESGRVKILTKYWRDL